MIQNQDGKSFLNKSGNYNELTDKQLEIRINDLLEIWNDFLIDQEENLKQNVDYFIHKRNLYEVIKRLDKRKTSLYSQVSIILRKLVNIKMLQLYVIG